MEKERVLEALKTIQEMCREHEACRTCPLRDDSDNTYTDCMLDNPDVTPIDWDFNTIDPPWRAIK